jgi:uncharacterized membrane protein
MREADPRSLRAVGIVASLAAAFTLAASAPAWIEHLLAIEARPLRLAYAPLCHQIAERSPALFGHPFAVCARCFGLYAGGAVGLTLALGLLARGRLRPRASLLVLSFAPMAIDVALPWIGWPGLSNAPRLLLALPAGLVAGLVLAVGVADLALMRGSIATVHSNRVALEETDG